MPTEAGMTKKRKNQRLRRAFGIVLRRLREENKLTQETLGFEAGLDRTYISLLERGIYSPTLESLAMICAALNTSLTVVVTAIDEEQTKANFQNKHD